jgi:hypothetical protein
LNHLRGGEKPVLSFQFSRSLYIYIYISHISILFPISCHNFRWPHFAQIERTPYIIYSVDIHLTNTFVLSMMLEP